MNTLPVLGAPLHWHPALLALTAIAVTPGVHLLASPLVEGRKVTWREDYAAVLVGDPLLALAAGLAASMSQLRIPIESVRRFRSNPYTGSGVFVHLAGWL